MCINVYKNAKGQSPKNYTESKTVLPNILNLKNNYPT